MTPATPPAGQGSAPGTPIPAKRWTYVIPVAVVMYMLAFLDRSNVSVILPYMDGDLSLSAADEGMVTGIFFLGYVFLQIPGAILAQRWSARKTVMILMIAWGVAAMACGLVQTKEQFYVARFVLGLFEGGVWPAVLILLASWFPLRERARANALWMACLPISSIIMAPLSGLMLDHTDPYRALRGAASAEPVADTADWQGLFGEAWEILRVTDAEEARAPRHRRWFDLGSRISEFLWSLTPRTLAWSATAVAVAIFVQAAVIGAVVVKEQGSPSGPGLASASNEGSYAVVRFAPQATANEITNFLGAYKATVVEGPLAGQVYRIRLSETKLPKEEVNKIVRQMQSETKIVDFIVAKE